MNRSRLWALSSSLALLAFATRAQTVPTGSINGRLTLEITRERKREKKPLSSAEVSAYLLDERQTSYLRQWTALTASDGRFEMLSLPCGSYVVTIRYQGRFVYQNKIQLSGPSGQVLEIDLKQLLNLSVIQGEGAIN
jgi:hypothetical protein